MSALSPNRASRRVSFEFVFERVEYIDYALTLEHGRFLLTGLRQGLS